MFSALKKWAKGGNEDSKLSTPMGVRAMGQALQRKFARGVQYNMKIVIKGDRNTGKSCLFQRLQGKPFNEQYIPTNEIQVASIHWNYRTTDDIVKVEVWDVVDKGRNKKSSLSSLKLENDKAEVQGEKDANVLDAEFVDVYKGAHGVLMTMDITKPWTFKYIERELPKVPPHIPVLVLANHRDMDEHRLVQTEEAVAFIEHLERPDRSPPVHYAETSMKNGFGLKYIHTFLNLPFLLLQRETLLKQLQVNAEDTESTLEELQIHKETEEQDYNKFVSMLDRRRKQHEAKKAAAAAAATEVDGQQSTSPGATPPTGAKNPGSAVSSERSSKKDKTLRRTPSATGAEGEAVPQNGLAPSPTNIDEFVPDDELDAEFLEEDKTAGKKRTSRPAAKKQPGRVEVPQDVSEESDSDSDGDARNPMVAGFAEDIDSEDESAIPVVTNHVNEDLSSRDLARASKKPPAAVTVESSASEEEEKEDESDEEEKRKERERRERENERTKAKKDREMKNESAKLKLEMPVNSSSGMEPVVDGFGLGTEDVDDWLNSPDSDPKIPLPTSPADKEYTVRKVDTRSEASSSASAPAIPLDDWEMFMASQMQPQTKTTTSSPSSLIDIGFDGEENTDTNEESKSRKKKEHKSGEKSKSKHRTRKDKDKSEEGDDSEKKERRKSRHREGDERKDRRKSRDEEGDKKKKHRSKHSRAKSQEGVQEGVTYEEL